MVRCLLLLLASPFLLLKARAARRANDGRRRPLVLTSLIGLTAVFFVGIVSVQAQPRSAPTPIDSTDLVPIREVQRDADGDLFPDRMNDTVTVGGRALYRERFIKDWTQVFVQDTSAGITLALPTTKFSVEPGDSLWARGVVQQHNGLTFLNVLKSRALKVPSRVPAPTQISLSEASLEKYESQLIELEGLVVNQGQDPRGEYLLIRTQGPNGKVLSVFVPPQKLEAIPLDRFEPGDNIRVTGVLGQFDPQPPPNEFYLLFPRSRADLKAVSWTQQYLRYAFVGGGLLLLLAVGGVLLLRYQVRRRTEQLANSRDLLHRTQEVAQVGGWEYDVRSDTLSLTDQVYRIYGLPPDTDVDLDTAIEHYTPEAQSTLQSALEDALDHGEGWELELPLTTANGNRRWVRSTCEVHSEDGDVVKFTGAAQDVTDRHEAQQALRRSRKKYKSLFEASTDAVFIHDLDGRILEANPQVEVLFGYTPDELVGLSVAELHPPNEDLSPEAFLQTVQQDKDLHAEVQFVRKDGTTFWGELSATSFELDEDTVVQGMVRDISERKQTEQALRESEEQLRGIANSVPGILYQFSVQPDGSPEFRYVSEQAETILGVSSEPEGFYERCLGQVPPSHREDLETSIKTAVSEGEGWNFEFPFTSPSGETIWLHALSRPERHEDRIVFHGVLLDITRRKQLNAQLRQAQKMETIGTLAGGIAHDFNNILHSSKVYPEMAIEDLPNDISSKAFLTNAERGLNRAESLVEKLLTFSRQEIEKADVNFKPVDVASVTQEAVELIEPLFPDDLETRTGWSDADSSPAYTVLGDAGQLQQVAMNLVTNAVQAMKAVEKTERVLDLDVRKVTIDEDLASWHVNLEPDDYVCLSVSDTGSGIDAETKERVFEPFFTTKGTGEGTGLGLSVTYGIVQAHNGEITITSEPGRGTTFNVYLPHSVEHPAPTDETSKPAPNEATTSNAHILCVDDEEPILEMEAIRLNRLGYQVTPCQSAQAALDAVKTAPKGYDLVLTDYAMPEMTGLELTRKLHEETRPLPVVLMSGFSAQVSEEDAEEAGVEAFLRKPVGTETLETLLATLLPTPPENVGR